MSETKVTRVAATILKKNDGIRSRCFHFMVGFKTTEYTLCGVNGGSEPQINDSMKWKLHEKTHETKEMKLKLHGSGDRFVIKS